MSIVIDQRVYRNKGNHRRIGQITDVCGSSVRVLWSGATASSRAIDYDSLTPVSIRVGATVVRGTTSPAEVVNAESTIFGIVTSVSAHGESRCTVTWDDRTITTQSTQEVMDVNWVPSVPLGDVPLQEWISSYQTARSIDMSNISANHYRCSRNHHIDGCLCHKETKDNRSHHIQASCMCQFHIRLLKDNTIHFSGTHIHHIPGTNTYICFSGCPIA